MRQGLNATLQLNDADEMMRTELLVELLTKEGSLGVNSVDSSLLQAVVDSGSIVAPNEQLIFTTQELLAEAFSAAASRLEFPMPRHAKDLRGHTKEKEFREAQLVELDALKKRNCWTVVKRPKGRKVVGTRWVFDVKFNPDGTIRKYKARFVVKGYSQVKGVDFDETYSPVISMVILRLVLAIAVKEGWEIFQLDIGNAFVNAPIGDQEIYIELPEGFKEGSEDECGRLNMSLYGLKQASKNWNDEISSKLKKELKQSQHDSCLFYSNTDGKICIVVVYVDDIVMTGNDLKKIQEVKELLRRHYEVKDMEQVHDLLKMFVNYDREKGELVLSQHLYVQGILESFQLNRKQKFETPAAVNTYELVERHILEKREIVASNFPYRECIGSLLYLAIMTRPDIANIVRYLSRFVGCFHELHVSIVQRVLGYLNAYPNFGIRYQCNGGKLVGYADASYGDDYFSGKSTTAHIVTYANGPIAWKSELSKFVVTSSTHAETAAISAACYAIEFAKNIEDEIRGFSQEPVIIQNSDEDKGSNLMRELRSYELLVDGAGGEEVIPIFSDNQAAIYIGSNDVNTKRAKHINVRFHVIREMVRERVVKLVYLNTKEQLADLLTKCLGKHPFKYLRDKLLALVNLH
jgi:hypothetical protein